MKEELTVSKNFIPPPTKQEIIQALLSLRHDEWADKANQAEKLHMEAKGLIRAKAITLINEIHTDKWEVSIQSEPRYPSVDITISLPLDSLTELLKQHHESHKVLRTGFDEKEELKLIREAVNGTKKNRVGAMLEDEETRKRLTTLGAELGVIAPPPLQT